MPPKPSELPTRAWKAWTDRAELVVTGQVCVGGETVKVALTPRRPQGVDPRVLLLEVWTSEAYRAHGPHTVWKTVRLETRIPTPAPEQVVVFRDERLVADIGVVGRDPVT